MRVVIINRLEKALPGLTALQAKFNVPINNRSYFNEIFSELKYVRKSDRHFSTFSIDRHIMFFPVYMYMYFHTGDRLCSGSRPITCFAVSHWNF